MTARKRVYNLKFPYRCSELNIFGYRFVRAEDYGDKLASLHHLVTTHSEFSVRANAGTHAVTAHVEIPENELGAVLEWSKNECTALSDVLLLLSIFTGREVFVIDDDLTDSDDFALTADPRVYQWGGILRTSLPQEYRALDTNSINIRQFQNIVEQDEEGVGNTIDSSWNPLRYNIGFEREINRIYELIRSKQWQKEYQRGYFLFLARSAFRRQTLESSFLQCWTIWEHLFSILNRKWLSQDGNRRLNVLEKIAFLAVEYDLTNEIGQAARKRLKPLVSTRNWLVHYGRFPSDDPGNDETTRQTAILFIQLTEVIIAKILGLQPSNVFNTKEQLESLFS